MIRIFMLVAVTALAAGCAPSTSSAPPAATSPKAPEVGRYTIVRVPQAEAAGANIILLDTATGKTWNLTENIQHELWWNELPLPAHEYFPLKPK